MSSYRILHNSLEQFIPIVFVYKIDTNKRAVHLLIPKPLSQGIYPTYFLFFIYDLKSLPTIFHFQMTIWICSSSHVQIIGSVCYLHCCSCASYSSTLIFIPLKQTPNFWITHIQLEDVISQLYFTFKYRGSKLSIYKV